MITKVTFTKKWRCFGAGDVVALRPGLNLLVGDQGAGKSSVMEVIRAAGKSSGKLPIDYARVDCDGPTKTHGFDFERDNPRMQSAFSDTHMMFEIAARFSSHGETVLPILKSALTHPKGDVVFLDEPDMALSPKSALALASLLAQLADGRQVIAAVHHPWVIESVVEVLDVSRRMWVASAAYLAEMRP